MATLSKQSVAPSIKLFKQGSKSHRIIKKIKTKFHKKENFINHQYFGGSDATN
jgi:hypothetical protein